MEHRSPSHDERGGQHLPETGVLDQPCGQAGGGGGGGGVVTSSMPQNFCPCFSNDANMTSAVAVSSAAFVFWGEPPAATSIATLLV